MAKSEGHHRKLKPAVFLDRDGTINVEKDYLYRIEDFEFIEDAQEAIKKLNESGYLVVVVTNQSGVARGYYSCRDVELLHEHIQSCLQSKNARIDKFYYCPHHPQKGVGPFKMDCDCRKGKPGMLLQAANDLQIDLGRSFVVGDKSADIEAARAAGCTPVLVRTGYGETTLQAMQGADVKVCLSICEAADFICSKSPA